ncbi:MAG: hypothetical protein KF819_30305 [Labilithrix sp.]|nr:hypothetical protein [Labilithrix sp.]
MRRIALALVALAWGCTEEPAFEPPRPAITTEPPVAAPTASERPPSPPCGHPTPLDVHHDAAGRVDRLHATLVARGIEGKFLVDTGALRSYATHTGVPEESKNADTVLDCKAMTFPIIARPNAMTTPNGEPRRGVLGADLLRHGAVFDFDLRAGTLRWYEPPPPPPAGAVVLPVEYRKGWLIASGIEVDGRDVKLVIDTGATNVIIIDKVPRPGEVREDILDGTASPVTLYNGEGDVAFVGGAPRRVPVSRSDDFPTLQGLIQDLGGDVAGLLGITSLGTERIVLGREALYVML